MSRLIILSGPSGSGKSTVIARLLKLGELPLWLSVSATTRPPRPGEQDGVQYYFWDRERFEAGVKAGEFLEWAEVHGRLYGTLRSEVLPRVERGQAVILDIDVQGAEQVRRRCPDSVSIFLLPPSWEELEQRLRHRHTENEAEIQRRLSNARLETARAGEYEHRVVNGTLDETVERVRQIIVASLGA